MIKDKSRTAKYPLIYVRSGANLTVQRNIGIKKSSGQYLYFFDDDVVLEKEYIETIMNTFEEFNDYNIGGISGCITNIKNEQQFIDRFLKKVFFLAGYGKGKIKLSGFPAFRIDQKLASVKVLTGCCMAFDRKVLNKFKFDEMLAGYSYMEDTDFSYRISRKFNLLYQPHAKLQHFSTTYRLLSSEELRKMLVRNHFYLFKKNFPKDLIHIFAFVMSIFGLIVYNALWMKDFKACLGILKGIITFSKIFKANSIFIQ